MRRKPSKIRVSLELPFKPSSREIIFIKEKYSRDKNDEIIIRNFKKIMKLFRRNSLHFAYLPNINWILSNRTLSYRFPYIPKEEAEKDLRKIGYSVIGKYIVYGRNRIDGAGLLEYDCSDDKYHYFEYYSLAGLTETELLEEIAEYVDDRQENLSAIPSVGEFMMAELKKASGEYADFRFDRDGTRIVNEIIERINQLRKWGISEAALKTLIEKPVVLSRIVITRDFRIVLPDYNDMEIKMSPLVKAVYILFLLHPEGIVFKHLPDHKKELLEIYKSLTNREDYDEIEKSIDDVTDPTKNSINEKCSRIKEAFLSQFCHDKADLYYVTAKPYDYSRPKRVAIDRSLVHFEDQGFLQGLQKYRLKKLVDYFRENKYLQL